MKKIYLFLVLISSFNTYADEETPQLNISSFSPNVYIHKSFKHVNGFGLVSSNGLIVIKDSKAFIIDTPWSNEDTEKLVNWVIDKGYTPMASLSTHSHEDRAAGIQWLNQHNIPTYASFQTNQILQKNNKAQAKHAFTEKVYHIEDGLIEVFYPGGGHTIDNLVVWLPQEKLLFGGCFVKSLRSKHLGYVGESILSSWSASIDNVISKYSDINTVIPGHGNHGNTNLLTHTQKLVQSALDNNQGTK